MSAHTPGPWYLEHNTASGDQTACIDVRADRGEEFHVSVAYCQGARAATIADAHLIAAAPDLLAVARELLGYVQSDYEGTDGADLTGGVIARAVAAIARAEGRE